MSKKDEEVFSAYNNDIYSTAVTPTYIYPLDFILRGGIRESEMYQFVAEPGLGKSTLALQIAKSFCAKDKRVIYVDSEGSTTDALLESTGVIPYYESNMFIYIRLSTFSEVEKVLDKLLYTDQISLVIIDSLATLLAEKYVKKNGKSITSNDTNTNSRQLTLFLNKYKALAIQKKFSIILINQYRNNVDMRKGTILKEYGSKSLRYNSDVIIRIKPNSEPDDFNEIVRNFRKAVALSFEVVKSNKSPPNESMPFCFYYGKGIGNEMSEFYALLKTNNIVQNGAWYSFEYDNQKIKLHGIFDIYARVSSLYAFVKEHLDEIDNFYRDNFRS